MSSATLASFASQLQYKQIPEEVKEFTVDLFVDWLGSALAGSNARPVKILDNLASSMGPSTGGAQIMGSRRMTSAYFAALVNAAASHVVEQDDLHNQSILHPATIVFPTILALAQAGEDKAYSGEDFITAAVAGYECGIRTGEYLGGSHYRVFHMTATAGTIGSAMAAANLLRLNDEQALNALGSAGTQAGGLWQFLDDAADSKQLHTAKACADGLLAALVARDGFTGAKKILEGSKGMAAGMLGEGDEAKITAGLGQRWATLETSFKFHSCCRHTHPAADAMLKIRDNPKFDYAQVKSVEARVYQAASDVLGQVNIPSSIHQSKFSMGFVLALIARYGSAGVSDFTEEAIVDSQNLDFLRKVEMVVDPDIEDLHPQKWTSKVIVTLNNGDTISEWVETPKGDPGNALSRAELDKKFRFLVQHFDAAGEDEVNHILDQAWDLKDQSSMTSFLVL